MCTEGKNTGSGEGRGPSDAKLRRQIGGYATDKERRAHDKGYGPRATPKERKRYWDGFFSRLPLPRLGHVHQ